MEAAINDNPDIPGFIRQFNPPFPVGTADHLPAINYMQISPMVRSYVPYMLFIDRKGIIREQHTGGDADYFNDQMGQHFREDALKLLAEPAAAAKLRAKPKRAVR